MTATIEKLADSFWNIRDDFKVLKVLNVGTQMSLAQLQTGRFVLLDSVALNGPAKQEVLDKTDGGRGIEAILNLHPFHTVHVAAVANAFPDARLYGTRRHVAREPSLRWESTHTEDAELAELFKEDFEFTVPRGVDFIPTNENLHFSSVLAFHRASQTLHVDDTLGFSRLPLLSGLRFHPTLGDVLQRRSGAAGEFRSWSAELVELCGRTNHLCTAHMRARPGEEIEQHLVERVNEAVNLVEKTLAKHEARHR